MESSECNKKQRRSEGAKKSYDHHVKSTEMSQRKRSNHPLPNVRLSSKSADESTRDHSGFDSQTVK
jgi:hypothetical protein